KNKQTANNWNIQYRWRFFLFTVFYILELLFHSLYASSLISTWKLSRKLSPACFNASIRGKKLLSDPITPVVQTVLSLGLIAVKYQNFIMICFLISPTLPSTLAKVKNAMYCDRN